MTETILVEKDLSLEDRYKSLIIQIKSLLTPEDELITNLANCTAALKQTFDKISWAGFYFYKNNELYLGPFQGKVACSKIKSGQGVCGKTAERRETIIVPDVSKFPGHIYCDADSKSEIVVPIFKKDGNLFAVLDLDSYKLNSFNNIDKKYLEEICKFLSEEIIK